MKCPSFLVDKISSKIQRFLSSGGKAELLE